MAKAKKTAKRAAIRFEDIEDTPLSKLSADRFLDALNSENLLPYIPFWPEKKKYELHVEPENLGTVPAGKIRDFLKGEKKKVEYELPPGTQDGNPLPLPFDAVRYQDLVSRLATDIEHRLRPKLGV